LQLKATAAQLQRLKPNGLELQRKNTPPTTRLVIPQIHTVMGQLVLVERTVHLSQWVRKNNRYWKFASFRLVQKLL
jgi:hypothetical protein